MRETEKRGPIGVGIIYVLLLSALLYFNPKPVAAVVHYFERLVYDFAVRMEYHPLSSDNQVVIVDIDDKSLKALGHWPWSRKQLAHLATQLFQKGADTVAFDIAFPEKERNPAEEVMQQTESSSLNTQLEEVKESFDADAAFAESLKKGASVLSFVFKFHSDEKEGVLPTPLMILTPELEKDLLVQKGVGFIANLPILQKAASWGGFINSTPDIDGVVRTAPLVLRWQDNLYPSLALAATSLFLKAAKVDLLFGQYKGKNVIEGVQLDQRSIATNEWGEILIPFRGPPYTIPYFSALDVLQGSLPEDLFKGRLIFIGSSATALGDLSATAIFPNFPSVEIQAQIATSLIDQHLLIRPAWTKGAAIGVVFFLGLFAALILPSLGPILSFFFTLILSLLLLYLNHFLWSRYEIVLSVAFPVFALFSLFVLNEICGYLFESGRRKKMKQVFGQYVPPGRIDAMLSQSAEFSLEGETREMTVLFADIRNFTALSETLSASEVKRFLNAFLTPMTEIIFEHKGTVDKYVGDMIMAFWGAPLEDPDHSLNAVRSAFEMQAKLVEINRSNKIPIRMGIGVNTGLMNVGDMGSQFRRAYTVLGDSVNLASRLENLTKLYQVGIIVGEETFSKTEKEILYRPLDKVQVKGKEKGGRIYQPLCPVDRCSDALKAGLNLHAKALDAYFHQRWDEAVSLFQQLKSEEPGLYELYLTRVEFYRAHPPGSDWDGTTILGKSSLPFGE